MHMSSDRVPPPITGLAAGEANGRAPFPGFDPPESNFWRLPNNWFDLVAGFTSWAEHKVVEYVLRHTWGYHEYGVSKLITMDEFMHGRKRRDGSRMDAGCGMAENSIKKGIADAVAHGFLTVEVDDRDRGRIRKFYAPRMRRLPADEGLHALDAQGHYPIPEGQELTPHPRALTLRPQALTPSPASIDPRTGQTPPRKTPREHTKKDNLLALAATTNAPSSVISPLHRGLTAAVSGDPAVAPREPVSITGQEANRLDDLIARLLAEGIAPARARSLVHSRPAERIERQLAWIDRRQYRNRAATLIRAIEDDFAPPPISRSLASAPDSFDPRKFYRGAYAVCSLCGARPCASDCPGPSAVERKSARI